MNLLAGDSAPVRIRAKLWLIAHARYFGTELSERSLVPDDGARLGETRFENWLYGSGQHHQVNGTTLQELQHERTRIAIADHNR